MKVSGKASLHSRCIAVRILLNNRLQSCYPIENSLPQPKQEHVVISRLVRELIKRCGSGDELLDTLVPILLEPGMLVPKSKKMRASARDLNLDNLGRMVDYCWMPLMTRLHLDLRAMSSTKDGEALSFWVSLVNGMLDKLIEANAPAPGTTAKTGSYLITICKLQFSVYDYCFNFVRSVF